MGPALIPRPPPWFLILLSLMLVAIGVRAGFFLRDQIVVPRGNLEVTIVGEGGSPIVGARVAIFQPEKMIAQGGVTNERGLISFPGIIEEVYYISTDKAGYKYRERGELVLANTTKEVTLTLTPASSGLHLTLEPLSLTLPQGSQGTATITLASSGASPIKVKLGASAVGSGSLAFQGISADFDPPSLALEGNGEALVKMTISTSPNALRGFYLLRIETTYEIEGERYFQNPLSLLLRVTS